MRKEILFNQIKNEVLIQDNQEIGKKETNGKNAYGIYEINHGGLILIDNHGKIMSKEKTKDLAFKLLETVESFPEEDYDESVNEYVDMLVEIKEEYNNVNGSTIKKKEKEPENGFVYFFIDKEGKTKIGKTKNLYRRMKELESKFGEIKILNYFQVDDTDEIERMFHSHYSHRNYTGEWFKFNKKELKEIQENNFPENILTMLNKYICGVNHG